MSSTWYYDGVNMRDTEVVMVKVKAMAEKEYFKWLSNLPYKFICLHFLMISLVMVA